MMENTPDIPSHAPPVSSCWPKPQKRLLAAVAVALVAAGVFLILSGVGIIPGIAALGIAAIITGGLLAGSGTLLAIGLIAHSCLHQSPRNDQPQAPSVPPAVSGNRTSKDNQQDSTTSPEETTKSHPPATNTTFTVLPGTFSGAVMLPAMRLATPPLVPKQSENFNQTSLKSQLNAHEEAKTYLKLHLPDTGTNHTILSPKQLPSGVPLTQKQREACDSLAKGKSITLEFLASYFSELGELNDVFSIEYTWGIQYDILKEATATPETIFIHGISAQYDGGAAGSYFTIPSGQACSTCRRGDLTQGPASVLMGTAEMVEALNNSANIGFNGLIRLLSKKTKTAVQGGYLMPHPNILQEVVNQLETKYTDMETIALEFIPTAGGYKESDEAYKKPHTGYLETEIENHSPKAPVHLILSAAPALSDAYYQSYNGCSTQQEADSGSLIKLQYLCALHTFRTQFQYVLDVAEKKPGKKIVFKPSVVGGEAFGNNPAILGWAFRAAAKEYQDRLKEHGVEVHLQQFIRLFENRLVGPNEIQADSATTNFAQTAGIPLCHEASWIAKNPHPLGKWPPKNE